MLNSALVDLVLFRHGIAEAACQGCDDSERSLTPHGLVRTEAVIDQLVHGGLQLDRLISSPYKRTVQTAQLIQDAGLAQDLEVDPCLRPGADTWPLIQSLHGRCCLVGHEPDLGKLAARLLGAPQGSIIFKKSGLALLRWRVQMKDPTGGAELHALLKPRLFLRKDD